MILILYTSGACIMRFALTLDVGALQIFFRHFITYSAAGPQVNYKSHNLVRTDYSKRIHAHKHTQAPPHTNILTIQSLTYTQLKNDYLK